MRKYSDADIIKAKSLRKEYHYSFAELQRLTGIPATTIRNWCSDDIFGTRWDTLLNSNERKRIIIKQSEIAVLETLKEIDSIQAKVFAALLYWCEGSKYPATNKVYFTNSDPALIKTFIFLLRKGFSLDEAKIRIHLQLHETHSLEDIQQYWSSLLNVPTSQFIKPTITKKKGGKHRPTYNGTCTIRYPDFRILLKLTGIYEEFATKCPKSI